MTKLDLNDYLVIIDSISKLFSMTPEQVKAQIQVREEARRMRVENSKLRFEALLERMTAIQELVVDKYECKGASLCGKILEYRKSRKVAIMMIQPLVWNGAKGCLMRKLIMVYPDGTTGETFEKTISIKQGF